ncbi:hypothetical protein BJ878DRAFT_160154 [Calycina marina]|uniref:Uncharacterized protein n=1 Tax=Calycina marina TaxID=1763456 RepID=A0A9P7YZI8_9HELO|nr:hypothetical protein BJ878DRAFT_160154 [Calycina marina]
MDFAPYQDQSPEIHRALSPPPHDRRSSSISRIRSPPPQSPTKGLPPNPWTPSHSHSNSGQPQASTWQESAAGAAGFGNMEAESGRGQLSEFETSLPIRLDYEACLAYLLLPPAGAVFLLLVEQKSDYVRFHAWQSALLFTFIFVLHLIFFWSSFISYTILICDVALIGYLALRAYKDADTLDRCEVPYFGRLASGILDDE